MGEFRLIDLIRQRVGDVDADVLLGIGDDAALLSVPPGQVLATSTDTLNQGIHFDPQTSAASIGHKALAVNLSDLAAMGANPRWVLLSISMPTSDFEWLEKFIDGFLSLASRTGVTLVGGDTCAGSLSINVTAMGLVPDGLALTRSGARPGDLVVVSGTLGDAALALSKMLADEVAAVEGLQALHLPLPRIALGSSLVGNATACIDISDGLLADLGHIAKASGCAAVINVEKLPASLDLRQLSSPDRWNLQLTGGDDYELCFTIPPDHEPQLSEISREVGIDLTVIGSMGEGEGVRCLTDDGSHFEVQLGGYEHFQ